ncbi:MAG: hypothetical protein H6766_04395 [Candidatus Peribacteria bacterium]|nr:MAG: hypothetical protein H6766_04395 [Candidatus Peribacteria bacterium]
MKRQELLEIFPTQTYFSSQQVRKFFPSLTSQHLYYRQQTAKIVQIRR